MKKDLLLLIAVALVSGVGSVKAEENPQIPNGDFETWTYDGENLPNNWNSFQTLDAPTGFLGTMIRATGYNADDRQVKRSTEIRPGSTGQYSCMIWARAVVGTIVAQGNLTSGRVHAGATTAADAKNYNYTDRDGSNTNNGVTNPCAMPFTGAPKSVRVWVKYVQAGSASDYGEHATAKFSAIIHSDADYISYGLPTNDTEENKALVVASAVKEIEAKDGEWQKLEIPFEYTNNGATAAYIQINASTNAYPGIGVAGDQLYIDDIELVYSDVTAEKVFDKDELYVTAYGETFGPMEATVYVTEYSDGTIDFALKDFKLMMDGEPTYVGNINVPGVPAADGGSGITTFSDQQTITIADGDDPAGAGQWIGPSVGPVPLDLSGRYDDEHLYVTISIDMGFMTIDVKLGDEGDVTAISAIEAEDADVQKSAVVYDVAGRRVSTMQPGRIYIVNGKKVIK